MDQKKWQYILIGLALIIALVGSYFGVNLPAPTIPPALSEQGEVVTAGASTCKICFSRAGVMTVKSGGSIVLSGGTLTMAGTPHFTGGQTTTGQVSASAGVVGNTGYFTTTLRSGGQANFNGGSVTVGQASATAGVVGNTGYFTTTLKSGGQADFNGGSVTVGQASATGAVVANSATITGSVGAASVTASGAVSGATVAATGAATAGTWQVFTKQATLTVTAGGNISPTGTYQPITADGAVGTSDITIPAAGRLLILHNVGAQTITITDTGTIMLSADAVLTQYDSLTMISDGTNLVQLSVANN